MSKDHICYCFNYTESDIEIDILENGKSTIEERIKAEKKAGSCECTTKNPSGKWCLGDVHRVVNKIYKKEGITPPINIPLMWKR